MTNCIFCKIASAEIPTDFIYEDDIVVAFKDIRPKARVHLLVIPKEHLENLAHASEKHASLIAHILLLLPKLAKAQGLENGFRVVINIGADGGQEIDHIHFHLLGGGLLKEVF